MSSATTTLSLYTLALASGSVYKIETPVKYTDMLVKFMHLKFTFHSKFFAEQQKKINSMFKAQYLLCKRQFFQDNQSYHTWTDQNFKITE